MRSLRALKNKAPVPYVSARGGLSIPWRAPSGIEAQMRAMESVGTVHAIVSRSSKAVAGVEWHLYRKAASGRKEDRVEVTAHAALDLWNQPNPFFTREVFVEAGQQHKGLTGEQWWVISRNPRSSLPLEMWTVRPDRMQPVPHPTKFLSGYMYTGPGGEEVALRLEDVIFIRTPHPRDPYRGISPIQPLLAEIDSNRYAAEWQRNFFMNSAEPGGIIELPSVLQDHEWDQLQARWNEQHKGVANAHRVAFLEHGTWKDRKVSQRDMQFVESSAASREIIREGLGFPKPMLGTVDDANRANMEAADVMFSRWLLVPDLRAMRGALNHQLLPLYGRDAARMYEFDYDDPTPADRELEARELQAKTEAAKKFVDMGFEPSSVAEALGLPEMEVVAAAGGDGLATPQQLGDTIQSIYLGVDTVITWEEAREILNRAGAGLDLSVQPPATIRRYNRGGQQSGQDPAAVPAARLDLHHHVPFAPAPRQLPSYNTVAVPARRALPVGAASEPDVDAVRVQHEEALAALLEAWAPIAEVQVAALAGQIEAAVDAGDTEALAALTVDSDESAGVLRRALGEMAESAAAQMAAEAAEQGVRVKPPRVDKGLRNAFGSELIEIAAATAALLAADTAASAGREALRLLVPGVRGSEVAEKVGGFLRGLKNWFRRDQLGGALHRAQNAGRVAALQVAPSARYFASERNDSNRCDPCREIDGTEFDDLGAVQAAYGSGGYLHCEGGSRCRGTVTAIWD
ncbi:phage portal protein [Streptomyces caniscabiei]|uniref:phage portal protein n=1 Tax=Streptomyces caniscabiei TaxID=2746961 RepID=UPI0029AC0144|nr:phage portal protein [Streptomyces caniscabiei]MDX3515899.1 phage portal protein [Streptomyces caniscabiei]MDX3725079.1 phage portal protein [Streptomyces caniscabiei]